MQTLNVGAGQTDIEYKQAEEQRRTDLRVESRDRANYFFFAAGAAALGTGLLMVQLKIAVSIGLIDFLSFYARGLGQLYPIVGYSAASAWVTVLVALGFFARSGHRWAFLAGIALYCADMLALISMFSLWSFGLHAFFVFMWFQGQNALKKLGPSLNVHSEMAIR